MRIDKFVQVAVTALCAACAMAPARCHGEETSDIRAFPLRRYTDSVRGMKLRTVAAELQRQTGIEIDLSSVDGDKVVGSKSLDRFRDADGWTALECLAEASGNRVCIGAAVKPIRFERLTGSNRPPVSIIGPFRMEPKCVVARRDPQSSKVAYELHLEVAWLPQVPVFRADSSPTIVRGADDTGRKLRANSFDSRIPAFGAATTLCVRLEGFGSGCREITSLRGFFEVTLAKEMLRFEFDDVTQPGVAHQQGVTVELTKFTKDGSGWIAEIELTYPEDGAIFESFETYWAARNKMALVSPDGRTRILATTEWNNGTSNRYRFKDETIGRRTLAELRGWKIEFEAPGTMNDYFVDFEFKRIRLP